MSPRISATSNSFRRSLDVFGCKVDRSATVTHFKFARSANGVVSRLTALRPRVPRSLRRTVTASQAANGDVRAFRRATKGALISNGRSPPTLSVSHEDKLQQLVTQCGLENDDFLLEPLPLLHQLLNRRMSVRILHEHGPGPTQR